MRTDAIRGLVDRAIGTDWPSRAGLRVVACDYATGERVIFDGRGAVTPGEAVAASCAIPAFYEPVRIAGAGTSTAASTRTRTSTCSPMPASTR